MIVGVEGFLGDGKTILMVKYALIDFKNGRKIYSNFKLNNINYEKLKIEDFLNTEDANKFKNCSIFIDEITLFMDCRRSSRKENIAISTLLRQSRKRSIDIYYTCQNMDETDLRLVRYTSVFVFAQRCYTLNPNTNKLDELKNWRNYTVIDERKRNDNSYSFNMDISKYYKEYDTDEIIESIYQDNKTKKANKKTI